MSTDLAITPDQTMFTDKQAAALRQLGVEGATNADLAVFFHVASRSGLDPFARQIYMISRKSKNKGVTQTIQTGIDGYRLIARRAATKYGESLEYEPKLWCGDDGIWRDVWLSKEYPRAAKAVILRAGKPFPAVAHWDEYVQTTYEGNPNQFWSGKPAGQLAKCAEALALRMAFPQELSGIYIDEEMSRADIVEPRPAGQRPGAKLRAAVGLPVAPPVAEVEVEVHDAELVPDERESPSQHTEILTDSQLRHMQKLFKEKLFLTPKDRHTFIEVTLDLPPDTIASSGDITVAQANAVISALQNLAGE